MKLWNAKVFMKGKKNEKCNLEINLNSSDLDIFISLFFDRLYWDSDVFNAAVMAKNELHVLVTYCLYLPLYALIIFFLISWYKKYDPFF